MFAIVCYCLTLKDSEKLLGIDVAAAGDAADSFSLEQLGLSENGGNGDCACRFDFEVRQREQ